MEDFSQLFNNENQSVLYKSRPEYSQEIVKEMINFWQLFNKDRKIENGMNIIDVGCGTGQLTKELIPYSKSLIGIDSSESQIKETQSLSLENDVTKFMVCSCYNLPSSDNSIDMITAAQCIHWFDLDKFYAEVDRSLKVGGVLVISVYKKGHFVIDGVEDKLSELNKFIIHDIWFDDKYFGLLVNDRLKFAASGYAGIPYLYPNTGIRKENLSIEMNITLRRYSQFLSSSSVYQRWKKANSENRDMVDIILEKILFLMGNPETALDTKVVVRLPLCLIMCSKV